MLNDLNILIGIEIELKIRGSTLPLFTHKTYYLTISFYCNCISTLNSLFFLGKITKLFYQCFLLGGGNSYVFSYNLNIYKIYINCKNKNKKNFGGAKAPPRIHVAPPLPPPPFSRPKVKNENFGPPNSNKQKIKK